MPTLNEIVPLTIQRMVQVNTARCEACEPRSEEGGSWVEALHRAGVWVDDYDAEVMRPPRPGQCAECWGTGLDLFDGPDRAFSVRARVWVAGDDAIRPAAPPCPECQGTGVCPTCGGTVVAVPDPFIDTRVIAAVMAAGMVHIGNLREAGDIPASNVVLEDLIAYARRCLEADVAAMAKMTSEERSAMFASLSDLDGPSPNSGRSLDGQLTESELRELGLIEEGD